MRRRNTLYLGSIASLGSGRNQGLTSRRTADRGSASDCALMLAAGDCGFLKTRTEAHVSPAVHSSRSVVDMLIGQRCDVGCAILSMNHASVHSERLISVRMVCALSTGHRLCALETIRPSDLIVIGERPSAHRRVPIRDRCVAQSAHGVEAKLQMDTQISCAIY